MREKMVPVSTADKIKILYLVHKKTSLNDDEWAFVNGIKALSELTATQSSKLDKLYKALRETGEKQLNLFGARAQ